MNVPAAALTVNKAEQDVATPLGNGELLNLYAPYCGNLNREAEYFDKP